MERHGRGRHAYLGRRRALGRVTFLLLGERQRRPPPFPFTPQERLRLQGTLGSRALQSDQGGVGSLEGYVRLPGADPTSFLDLPLLPLGFRIEAKL